MQIWASRPRQMSARPIMPHFLIGAFAMNRAAIAPLVLFSLVLLLPLVPAQGDKPPEVKEIMGKVNKPTGLYFNVAKELKESDPMWDDIKADAKEIARLGAVLGKNDPPKGDKDSWQKLTKAYADNTKALEAAVAKMDKEAAKAASDKIGKSCEVCHKAHKKQP